MHELAVGSCAAGQNLAREARLGAARLSPREAADVRKAAPSCGASIGPCRTEGRGLVELATGPAVLHAVLRNVADEDVRRKVCCRSGACTRPQADPCRDMSMMSPLRHAMHAARMQQPRNAD